MKCEDYTCKRCAQTFSAVRVTRAREYCAPCKAEMQKEWNAASAAKRKELGKSTPNAVKKGRTYCQQCGPAKTRRVGYFCCPACRRESERYAAFLERNGGFMGSGDVDGLVGAI